MRKFSKFMNIALILIVSSTLITTSPQPANAIPEKYKKACDSFIMSYKSTDIMASVQGEPNDCRIGDSKLGTYYTKRLKFALNNHQTKQTQIKDNIAKDWAIIIVTLPKTHQKNAISQIELKLNKKLDNISIGEHYSLMMAHTAYMKENTKIVLNYYNWTLTATKLLKNGHPGIKSYVKILESSKKVTNKILNKTAGDLVARKIINL